MSSERISPTHRARTADDAGGGRDPKSSMLPLLIGLAATALIVGVIIYISITNNAGRENPPAAPSGAADHSYAKILTRDEARAVGLFDAGALGKGATVTLDRQDWPAVVAAAQIAAAGWTQDGPHEALKAVTGIAERGNALDNDLLSAGHPRDQLPSMNIEATPAQWQAAAAALKEAQPLVPSDAAPALERSLASIQAQLAK